MLNGNETLTLDSAFEIAKQVEDALKKVSDARYAQALTKVREMLERAVEVRDQMVSLDKSRGEARQHYEMLMQQSESLRKDIVELEKQKIELQGAVDGKTKALDKLRADAKRVAEKIAND